jgi:hypothetical protein
LFSSPISSLLAVVVFADAAVLESVVVVVEVV